MKSFIILLSLLVVGTMQLSADTKDILAVHMKSGDKTIYSLNEVVRISYLEDKIVVETAEANESYERKEILKINFSENSSIEEFEKDANLIMTVSVNGNTLRLNGLCEPTTAFIFDTEGILAMPTIETSTGIINISNLASGVYFVKLTNGKTAKFVKR